MPPEFVSPLIGVLIFTFVMVAVLLYLCLSRNHKGGQKAGESVNAVATYVDHTPYYSYTLCGGVYYSYHTADLGTSHIAKNVIVSIAH